MNLIRSLLRRPASMIMVIIAVVVFGVSSLAGMPLEYMPDMDMPMELVLITWPGADADSIERLVTETVEEECETLTDINTVSSYTYDNYTMVQLQYNYSVDLDDAYMELKAAMDNLFSELPDGCQDPIIMEISTSASATMSISAASVSGADVQAYLNDTVAPALESLSGVAKVDISGAQEEYLRIVLDEAKLKQYGLTVSAAGSAIAAADFDMPVGNVVLGTQEVALSASGDIEVSTQSIRNVPVQTKSGQLVKLSDLYTFMNLYHEEANSISRNNGMESVLLNVTKQNSASTLTVCSRVEEALQGLNSGGDIDFQIVHSEADSILSSLLSVVETLLIGACLTMLVLFLFFGDIRASLIVGCSMPLSILIAVFVLNLAGFNFDIMVGTSLVIAIGMIVDNSIVVLESCMRAREQGLDFMEAAAQGAGEVVMSVFAGTVTTVVVYIPLAMAGGMAGQMASPLSWTIALAMVSSLLCAVTVVPLAFTLIRPVPKSQLPINRLLEKIRTFYRHVTPKLLRRPGRVLLSACALLLAAVFLACQLEFVLFPSSYDGSIQVEAAFRSGTKLAVMDEAVRELENALLEDENFDNVTLDISGNTAVFSAYAVDGCRRSSEDAVELYTERFSNVAGMDVSVSPSGGGSTSSLGSDNTVSVTLAAEDLDTLEECAAMVQAVMEQTRGVIKIDNDFSQSCLQGRLVIDSQKALALGMTQAYVATQVSYMLNGMTAATIDYRDKEYDVKLEYPEGRFESLTALMDQPITSTTGAMVALSDIATIEYENTLPNITRQDGDCVTTVTATTSAAKYTASDAINAAVGTLIFPDGAGIGQSAMDKLQGDEISNMMTALVTGVFLVFLVMSLQFDSPKLSTMVMTCIPFSLIGSFLVLFLTGNPLSLMGIMGFLMLFGIVVNNGILLVDATNELRKTLPLQDALIQAGTTRLRPILMTTLTTVLSMAPMLFSSDSGMGMMKEMAYIIIGGLIASTLLTLFLMPSFYLLIRGENADGTKRGSKRRKRAAHNGSQEK